MKTKPKKLRVKVRRQTRSNLRTPDAWLRDILVGDSTTSGFAVNESNCLTAVVVYACVRNLSEDIAKLPLFLYRRLKPRGKERADELPLYRLLHDSPNDEMTSFDFRQAMMVDVLLGGNGYAHIMRTNGGQPLAFVKLARNRVTPKRNAAQEIIYEVKNDGIPDAIIPAEDMIHVRNMGDGLVGWSIIKLARESIGLSLSAENSGSSFFGNSSLPAGVLKTKKKMNAESMSNLRDSWDRLHQGTGKRHKIAILEEDMEFSPMSISPDDAQFLETRQFQVDDVARWFRMPPHKIGNMIRATGWSTLEATNTDYIVDTLLPWTERWEQELQRKLLTPAEQRTLFVEHLFDALLRGDSAARAAFYTAQFNVGAMSPNDIRESENRNPAGPEGDLYWVSTQVQPMELAAEGPPDPAPATPNPANNPPANEADAAMQRKLRSVHFHHKTMLEEAFGRLLALEMDKMQRMSIKPDFAEASARFYADHALYVRGAVSSIFTSYCAAAWAILTHSPTSEAEIEQITGEIVKICGEHAERSCQERTIAAAVAKWPTRAKWQAEVSLDQMEEFLKQLTKPKGKQP